MMRLAALVCIAWAVLSGHPFRVMDVRAATEFGEGDAAKGKIIFVKYCAGCHGPEGRGDGYRLLGPNPANLTDPVIGRKSRTELLKTLHEGKPNMPPWRARLTNEESRDVLAYVRTLSGSRDEHAR